MTAIDAPIGNEGYLLDPNDWTEAIAEQFAADEDLELTDEHWFVIRFVREWFVSHGVAPSGRDMTQYVKGQGKSRNLVFQLFPYGYVQQTCKIAGMIKPRSWSTG